MILLNGKEVQYEKFPNGETRMIIDKNDVDTINSISFKYHDDSDLIKLLFLKRYIDEIGLSVLNNLTIYYMPYSRMDRKEGDSVFTLKYISEFINYLKFNQVEVIEPHSDVTAALLNKVNANFINFKLLPMVMNEIGFDKDLDFLFFPDAGAQKRYHNLIGYKQLVGYKNRDFQTGEIKDLQVVGKIPALTRKIIIVDDLTSYGGTFLYSGLKLKELGFEEIYLLVAHAEDSVFQGKLLKDDSPVKKIFTTNSLITKNDVWKNVQYNNKLKVYKLEELLNEKY